jgi:hypothetical protein
MELMWIFFLWMERQRSLADILFCFRQFIDLIFFLWFQILYNQKIANLELQGTIQNFAALKIIDIIFSLVSYLDTIVFG